MCGHCKWACETFSILVIEDLLAENGERKIIRKEFEQLEHLRTGKKPHDVVFTVIDSKRTT